MISIISCLLVILIILYTIIGTVLGVRGLRCRQQLLELFQLPDTFCQTQDHQAILLLKFQV